MPDPAVQMEDIVLGHGSTPVKGCLLDLHYTLTIDGFHGKKIDSSHDREGHFTYVHIPRLLVSVTAF